MKTTGIDQIVDERRRQMLSEGFTAAHDDEHWFHELSRAAQCYILAAQYADAGLLHLDAPPPGDWPWERSWWKPSPDPVRNLVKAGALLAAEVDRLQRRARKVPA